MNSPTIEEIPGTAPDLAAMRAEAHLPTDDLAEPGRRFFRFSEGGRTIGFNGWETEDGAHALLRSTVVAPDRRGHGDGSEIIRWALTRLAELGFTDSDTDHHHRSSGGHGDSITGAGIRGDAGGDSRLPER